MTVMKPSCQFTRQQRLRKPTEFKSVFDQPCKSSDNYFTVLARTNTLDTARLGLAIAKKKVKAAVARNHLKRIIRESFRHQQQGLVGLDCVVLAKAGADKIDNQTLLCSLARHWQNLARRCKKA